MGSHSVTCHLAEVTFPPLPSQLNCGCTCIFVLSIAVSEAEQRSSEEVDSWRDCKPDVSWCPAFHGAYRLHQHAVVGAIPDVHLALPTVDGSRPVDFCWRRGHGADDSVQCSHCQENASIPGSIAATVKPCSDLVSADFISSILWLVVAMHTGSSVCCEVTQFAWLRYDQ